MSAPRRRLRRQRPSPAARLRPFWLLLVLALVLVVAVTLAALMLPIMRPQTIVVNGNHVATREEILERARVDQERTMWVQNPRAMAERIEAIPIIASVQVHRRPPSTLVIDVSERTPYAVLATGVQRAEVDRSLRVLAAAGPADSHLPVLNVPLDAPLHLGDFVSDVQALALRDDNEALAAGDIDGVDLAHDKYGDLVVELRTGVNVLFGDERDLAKKIPLVSPILHQVGRAGRAIAAIDLRAPNTPIVVYKK